METENYYLARNSRPLVSFLSQKNPLHILSNFLKIHFNVILLSIPRSSNRPLSFRYSPYNILCISHPSWKEGNVLTFLLKMTCVVGCRRRMSQSRIWVNFWCHCCTTRTCTDCPSQSLRPGDSRWATCTLVCFWNPEHFRDLLFPVMTELYFIDIIISQCVIYI